jgi:hypothetical protein
MMKNFLFDFLFEATTRFTYALIWFSDRFFAFPVALLMWLQQTARVSVCKMVEAESEADPIELKVQSMELKLLESSYKVRDHAQETGDWTDHHTEAIEAIGNALLLDIGWDEQSVEQHMKSVVESIDGLEFDAWFEDDD